MGPAPTAHGSGPSLARRLAELCAQFRPLLPPGSALNALDEIDAGLAEPLRVAVTGRVNAGKSTLVNALLGQRVAPTDVSECTRYVTWYRYGLPERVDVVLRDGTTQRTALRHDGSLPSELNLDPGDVRHLEVYLGNETLRDLTVIDTPGLASASGRGVDTTQLLALDVTSRLAVARADAVLYALTAQALDSELEALEGFRAMTAGLSTTALNAVGVLSRADQIDGDDPLDAAGAVAVRLNAELRGSVGAIVPVVGLLGETVGCGLLREEAFDAIRMLADLDEATFKRLTLSADRFASSDSTVPAHVRRDLLERLDLWGIERAIEAVRGPDATTRGLLDELHRLSGMPELHSLLERTFSMNADVLKAAAALAGLERLAYSGMGSGPLRQQLLDALEEVRFDPTMHRLAELRAWLECESGAVRLAPALRSELDRVTLAGEIRERLGLDPGAAPGDAATVAHDAIARWKSLANDVGTDTATRAVADVMVRSFERIWLAVRAEGA